MVHQVVEKDVLFIEKATLTSELLKPPKLIFNDSGKLCSSCGHTIFLFFASVFVASCILMALIQVLLHYRI